MDTESLNTTIALMSNEQLQAVKTIIDTIMADSGKGDAMLLEVGKRTVTTERYVSYQIQDRVSA